MSSFRHHPDGLIFLGDLQIPFAFWQQQEPAYTLPAGAIGREYVPGIRHTLSDGSSQWGGALPWFEGDRYLSTLETYRAAWTAANAPTPAPVPPDWGTFRTRMLNDTTYQQMAIGTMATPQGTWLLTTLQDVITMPMPSIALFQPLWNQIIQLKSLHLVAADVTRWQSYADSNHIGIKFLSSGAIQ